MSDEPDQDTGAPTHASGGAGWKWLASAAAAAVLLGGGYLAWQNLSPTRSSTELASNAAPADQTYGDTAPPSQVAATEPPSNAETAPATSQETPSVARENQPAAAPPAHRRATARAAAAPEEVVAIAPASATVEDTEPLIVQGVRRPVWTRAPSARRLSATYPTRALEFGREGEASVHCTIQEGGALDCVRVSETPLHAGFGRAALRVARMYRHATELADGSAAVGSAVNLRVVFRLAEDDRRRG